MKLMLDCQEVSRLVSGGMDQDLPAADRVRMRLHLVMCNNCRNVEEQMAFLRRAMRALGRDDPLPPASTSAPPR